jgi:hypothetical protein
VLTLAEITPETIFKLHEKIRWAGLATDQGEVAFVKMRPGVQSLSPEPADHSFIQLGPMLLSGVGERLVPWAGSLEVVVCRYEKVVLFVTKLKKSYLAVTIDRDNPEQVIAEVLQALHTLAH